MPKNNEKSNLKNTKSFIYKLFLFFIKIVVLLFILSLLIIIPNFIFKFKENQKNITLGKKSDIFYIPVGKPPKPMAILKFPSVRESQEREFKIKLNDLVSTVTLSLYLAYDSKNISLGIELNNRIFQIQDRIQYVISSKNYDDLNMVNKRYNIIKKELINEINSMLNKGKIKDIYFTKFYIVSN